MASTSLTGSTQIKYDVFINCRGRDTRKSFTSHLRAALERNGIDAFTDKGLKGGEEISDTLLTRISESQVSVVIFSPNYADSRWCLDELVKINQLKEEKRQVVLPVFLGVEPTHVRNQTDAFGEGFRKLLKDHQYVDKVESWRHALQQTANLSGWDSNQTSEEDIIEQLLKRIQNILGNMTSHDSDHNFIGIRRVEEVESLLFSPDVNSLGIWGMGGSGKTTLAYKVFNRISSKFDGVCFVENVSDKAKRCGLDGLRKYMLSQILGKSNIDKGPHIFSGDIRRKLQRKQVLIVLDDVSNSHQLETIIGGCGYYCPGSKIIATSRDKRVLTNGCQRTYEVKTLDHEEALQLLKLHIFKQRQPTAEHIQLLEQAIKYTQGLPLALVVLGRNLYDKDIRYWISELAKISDIPDMQIMEILRTSFDGLEDTEKGIFLDVACLFKGWNKDRVENILDACGFYAIRGIDRLVDKALLTISNQTLQMHDLLQQMGQHIAFDESIKETGGPSRLWRFKDIIDVLTKNRGTKTMSRIEVISLDLSKATNMQLKSEVFKKMRRLRVLRFHSTSSVKVRMLLPEGLKYLPDTLRYFRWDVYPLPTLPPTFAPENLVEFRMAESHLKQLWSSEDEPCLPNLKTIDLSGSRNLVRLPTFRNALNLERLVVPCCENLEEFPDSLQHLVELEHIILNRNISLHRLPECSHLMKLEILSILGCSRITKLPELPPNLAYLNLSHTAIKELPSSIGCLSQLKDLNLYNCKELESLPSSIGELKHLKELDLGGCPKLLRLPASLGELKSLASLMIDGSPLKSLSPSINHLSCLKELICFGYKGDTLLSLRGLVSLETLDLRRGGFKSLHEHIKYLSNLWWLNLSDCKCLSFLPELPSSLEFLDASNCTSLVKYTHSSLNKHHQRSNFPVDELCLQFDNCFNLEGDEGNKIISYFWQRIQLFSVSVDDKYSASEIVRSSSSASTRLEARLCFPGNESPKWFKYSNKVHKLMVRVLHFHSASSVKIRMLLPEGLEYLPDTLRYFLWDVYPLPTLPPTSASENLVEFRMVNSHLKQLWSSEVEPCLPNLKTIDLSGSKNLIRLPNFMNALKLETLEVPFCKNLEEVPDSLQHLVELKHIVFHGNKSLPRLPKCSTLMKLEIISLLGCSRITKLPEFPPNLAFLNFSHTAIKELPSSIGCLSQLEYLNLCDCKELESLPSSIGELKHLKELELGGCPKLSSLPASLGELKSLASLMIHDSPLKSLSPHINRLSCLKKLIYVGYKGDALLSLTGLVSLRTLDLRRSGFKSLHEDIKYLSNLWSLNLSDCKCLSFLPELPSSLQSLDASNCTSLVTYTHSSLNKYHQRSNFLGIGLHLQFNNCFNLEGDERNKIISDFWQRSQLITNSSPSRGLEALLCFPGSEVPKCFKYSNIGSSLQIKKANHKRRLDFYGLAFCIVVAFPPNLNLRGVGASCNLLTKSGKGLVSRCNYYCGGDKAAILQTEHLIMWHNYFGPSHFYFTEASFQFSVVCFGFHGREMTNDLEIVKCGVTPFGIKCGAGGLPSVGEANYREEEEGPRLLKKSEKRKQRIQGDQEVRPCHKRPKNLEILHDQKASKQKKKNPKGNQYQ